MSENRLTNAEYLTGEEPRASLLRVTEGKNNLLNSWEVIIADLLERGVSSRLIAADAGVSHVTVYRIAKAVKARKEGRP